MSNATVSRKQLKRAGFPIPAEGHTAERPKNAKSVISISRLPGRTDYSVSGLTPTFAAKLGV